MYRLEILIGLSHYFLLHATAVPFTLPLKTEGRYIVDQTSARVKLQCVNWYGAHLKTFVQNGLSKQTPASISRTIAGMGFNCVRLSYSTEAYMKNPPVRPSYISKLANSTGRRFLDVFDEVVFALVAESLMVIVNNHNTYAGWCCGLQDGDSLWFSKDYPEEAWIASLQGMARRYKEVPLVIGYDLRNEPRFDPLTLTMPVWGVTEAIAEAAYNSSRWLPITFVDWREAIERASVSVLEQDPNALIIVELLFATFVAPCHLEKYPLRGLNGHVVWSAHEYFWLDDMNSYVEETILAGCKISNSFIYDSSDGAIYRWLYTFGGELKFKWQCLLAHGAWFVAAGACAILSLRRSLCSGQHAGACSYFCAFIAVLVLGFLALVALATAGCASGAVFCGSFEPLRFDDYEGYVRNRDTIYGHIAKAEPLLIGEFGDAQRDDMTRWNWTVRYLRERDLDFAYWSVDGDHFPQEAMEFGEDIPGMTVDESFGLLNADYESIREAWKLADVQLLMHPNVSSPRAQLARPSVSPAVSAEAVRHSEL